VIFILTYARVRDVLPCCKCRYSVFIELCGIGGGSAPRIEAEWGSKGETGWEDA
jgi:hypothetical protein